MSRVTAYAFTFKGLDGSEILLSSFAGRPILVVNTASLCGYTPQYTGLQALWTQYRSQGADGARRAVERFRRPGAGRQGEIVKTAQDDYHVTFPLTEKVAVKGPAAHPFYRWAAQERPLEAPRWNFHKYLIGRDGRLKARLYLCRRAQRSEADRGDRAGIGRRAARANPLPRSHGGRHKSNKFRLTNQRVHDEFMTEFWSRGPAGWAGPLRCSSRVAFRLGGRKAAPFHFRTGSLLRRRLAWALN